MIRSLVEALLVRCVASANLGWQDAPGWMRQPTVINWANDAASITWTAPESTKPILDYDLESAGVITTVTATSTSIPVTAPVLVRVRARNVNGHGMWSTATTVFPTAELAAPATVKAIMTEKSISLEWEKETSPNFARYEVTLTDRIDPLITSVQRTVLPMCTFAVTPFRTYNALVRTCTSNTCSASPKSIDLLAQSLPSAPNEPMRSPDTDDFVLIWTLPSDSARANIVEWKIYLNDEENLNATPVQFTVTERSWLYNGCTDTDAPLYVRVSAVNAIGEGKMSPRGRFYCGPRPDKPAAAPVLVVDGPFAYFTLPVGPVTVYLRWQLEGQHNISTIVLTDQSLTEYRWGPLPFMSTLRLQYAIANKVGKSSFSPWGHIYIAPFLTQIDAPRGRKTSNTQLIIDWDSQEGVDTWDLELTENEVINVHALSGDRVTLTHTCVASNAPVTFRLRGVNVVGAAPWSQSLTWACVGNIPAPPAPIIVAIERSYAVVSWSIPTAYAAIAIGTRLKTTTSSFRRAGGYIEKHRTIFGREVLSFNVSTAPSREYWYSVRIITVVGDSLSSQETKTLAASVPRPLPRPLAVTSTSDVEITLAWDPLTIDDGGSVVTKWHLYVSIDGTSFTSSPTYVKFDTDEEHVLDCRDTAKLGGIVRSQHYLWFTIAAVNLIGEGHRSPLLRARCSAIPDAMSKDAIFVEGQTFDPVLQRGTITITWNEPTVTQMHGAGFLAYKIYVDDGNKPTQGPYRLVETITDFSHRYFTRRDCVLGYTYKFQVVIQTEIGENDHSDPAAYKSFIMQVRPDPPTSLYVAASSNTYIDLRWKYERHFGGGVMFRWNCYASPDGITWPAIDAPTVFLNYLEGQSPWECKILCVDHFTPSRSKKYVWMRMTLQSDEMYSEPSETIKFRCSSRPENPGASPTKISATMTSSEFRFAPSTDMHGAELVGYQFVYLDNDASPYSPEFTVDAGLNADTVNVTGLIPGHTYKGRGMIISETGMNFGTAMQISWIQAGIPEPPDPPVCASFNGVQLKIKWKPYDKFLGGVRKFPTYHVYLSTSPNQWPEMLDQTGALHFDSGDEWSFPCDQVPDNLGTGNRESRLRDWAYLRMAIYDTAVFSVSPPSDTIRCFCSARPPPMSFTVASAGREQITVQWESPSLDGAPFVAYHLYMDDGLGGDLISVLNITEVEQRVVSLEVPLHGSLYRLGLEIESAAFTSIFLPLTSWACGAPSKPAEPIIVYSTDPTTFTVTWDVDVASGMGGCPLAGFLVLMDTPDQSDVNLCDPVDRLTNPDLRSCIASGLTVGAFYTLRVVVYNLRTRTFGFPKTVQTGVVPFKMDALTQTTGVGGSLVQSTTREIRVTWIIPSTLFNGETPVGFALYRDDGDGSAFSEKTDPNCVAQVDPGCTDEVCETVSVLRTPHATTCAIPGLREATAYRFQIAAINVFGHGARSDIVTFETGSVPDALAITPYHVSSNVATPSLTFAWKHMPDRGNFVFNYRAEIRKRKNAVSQHPSDLIGTWTGSGTIDAPQRILSVEFDATNTVASGQLFAVRSLYQVRIGAQNLKGWSLWSPWSHTKDSPPNGWLLGPCDKITNLRRANKPFVRGVIQVAWDKIDTIDQGGGEDPRAKLIKYQVFGRKLLRPHFYPEWDRSEFTLLKDVPTVWNVYGEQIDPEAALNVEDGSQWQLKVRAFSTTTEIGGEFSDVAEFIAAAPMAPVRNLMVANEHGGPVARWLPPAHTGSLLIMGYKVTVANAGTSTDYTVPNTQLHYEIAEAAPLTVAVRAFSILGDGTAATATHS